MESLSEDVKIIINQYAQIRGEKERIYYGFDLILEIMKSLFPTDYWNIYKVEKDRLNPLSYGLDKSLVKRIDQKYGITVQGIKELLRALRSSKGIDTVKIKTDIILNKAEELDEMTSFFVKLAVNKYYLFESKFSFEPQPIALTNIKDLLSSLCSFINTVEADLYRNKKLNNENLLLLCHCKFIVQVLNLS